MADHPQLAIAFLLGWVLLYVVYRVAWRRDYGLPVHRRLMTRGLVVHDDQSAEVPIWWSDLQVQRAVDAHWRRQLASGFSRGSGRAALEAQPGGRWDRLGGR